MIGSPSGEPGSPVRSIDGCTARAGIAANAPNVAAVRAALDSLYEKEYFHVIRMLMRLGSSLPDAEDAVQEAFLEAWASLIKHPNKWGDVHEPGKWIRAIALKKYRSPPANRRRPLPMPIPEIPENESSADAGHEELTLETLYVIQTQRNLHPLLQDVLTLHMDGFSAREIAVHLCIKDDQEARDLLKKARKILRRELADGRHLERRSS
jgi:DNA-directed RNA polymerase specialized sigma24 family protein